MRGLAEKTVVITGAASGIGRATARRFAEEEAHVILTDVDTERGTEAADELDDVAASAEFRELDVQSYDAFEETLTEIGDEYDGVDVLFNNAGIGEDGDFEGTTIEERDRLIDVNVKGVWNGCHAALPVMRANGSGVIVNSASMAGWLPVPLPTYGLTKAAVLHFSRSIAHEFGRHGIRVNAVCPGVVETQMTQKWYSDDQRESMVEHNPIPRAGDPEEIASGVAFLASEDASYITGRALKIDGGYL